MSKKLFVSRRIIGPCYGLSGCPPARSQQFTPAVRIMISPELDPPDKIAAFVPRDAGLKQVVLGRPCQRSAHFFCPGGRTASKFYDWLLEVMAGFDNPSVERCRSLVGIQTPGTERTIHLSPGLFKVKTIAQIVAVPLLATTVRQRWDSKLVGCVSARPRLLRVFCRSKF
jgi:hypothetical protein